MNVEALQRVAKHLQIIGVRPINISFSSDPEGKFLTTAPGAITSFSRFQWTCTGRGDFKIKNQSDEVPRNVISLIFNTVVNIAVQPESGPIPESDPIPENLMIAKIEVVFAVDYQVDVEPETLDVEGINEFIQSNAPYHFWPYWREVVQSLSLRGQVPVPSLPHFRVVPAAQNIENSLAAEKEKP